jgi:uncharacterized protein YraI
LESFTPSKRPISLADVRPAPAAVSAIGLPAILQNRFILGGLGIVAVLLLTAIVLVAIGHGDDVSGGGGSNVAEPPGEDDGDETPSRPPAGLVGRAITTASYRNGPDTTFVILGTIPRGATVALVGRSEDNAWLQVRYPPTSNLKGWVDAKQLDVEGNVRALVVAGPGPVANAEDVTFVPTAAVYVPPPTSTLPPVVIEEETPEPTVIDRPTREPTARPTVTPYRTPIRTNTPPPVATKITEPTP